jgi:enoyl-CoA hydratase/carnithine racemase
MQDYPNLQVSVQDRVAILTVDHPPVNTIDTETFASINSAVEDALADDEVKVIVITGTGRSFLAGADVQEFQSIVGTPVLMEKIRGGQAVLNKIERSPKPVIAAINGRYCLGGGNELILACHIRIAEESVKFGQTEVKLGLIPGWGGSQRLARLVGLGRALEMILTGDHIRAKEAYRIGLVNKLVPAGEALNEALRLAKRMTALSSLALAKSLQAVYGGIDLALEDGLALEAALFAEMAETEDMREGLGAFLEKRRPQFTDR